MRIVRGLALMAAATGLSAADVPPPNIPSFGANLERFEYPWPVQTMTFDVTGEAAQMAFMDIAPARPNGQSVVLLHGKNFCSATWESTAQALTKAGYRVLIPDQIGFCKSSKPRGAQYSFAMMAEQTKQLMAARGISHAIVVGHSFGGMLAMRFAIEYPELVDRLVLVNPLGLKDRSEEGLGYTNIDTLWAAEKRTSFASLKTYEQANYYHGTWKPEYERWVWLQAGMYQGAGRDAVALAQAKTSEMIHTQTVAHELERITPPTTLIVGTLDRTAFGRQQAPASLQRFLEAIPLLAPAAARRMKNAVVVPIDGVGHAPQIEAPDRFNAVLLGVIRPRR